MDLVFRNAARCLALLLVTLPIGCFNAKTKPSSHVKEDTISEADKLAWLAKVTRTLRNGAELDESEIEGLMPLSRSEIVDKLMTDPRFGDTALAFNMFFLGFKTDTLKTTRYIPTTSEQVETYRDEIFNRPQAITAARELLLDGDYLKLFDYDQPFYLPANQSFPEVEERLISFQKVDKAFESLLANFGTPVAPDRDAGCSGFNEGTEMEDIGDVFNLGISSDFSLAVVTRIIPTINIMCSGPVPAADIYKRLAESREAVANIFEASKALDPQDYPQASVLDLKTMPVEDLHSDAFGTSYSITGFWQQLPNSSTNYNRRRGAYVLKTYFCDDLTPLNVVLPDAHGEGAHATEPSCQACHYKLDPMAGTFRNRGFFGFDFKDKSFVSFDDQASVFGEALIKYNDSWKASTDAGHDWNVGYIRSTTQMNRNTYEPDDTDEPLRALHAMLRTAKEPKQCLTRRMAQYFLGSEQVFDGGWVQAMAKEFDTQASSSAAAKSIIKQLVMSRTFTKRNPSATQCYDPPEAATSPIPCEVRFTLQNNCAGSCHGADDFDLTDKPTLEEMQRRVTSTDLDERMPLNKDMPDPDRVRLVKWLDKTLSAPGGTP